MINRFFINNVYANDFWGEIAPPQAIRALDPKGGAAGLVVLINNGIKLVIFIAGVFALFNFIIAGYQLLASGGDSQKVEEAWNKIFHSLLGVAVIAAAFVLAAIMGLLLFNDASYFLQLRIWVPDTPPLPMILKP